MNNKKWVKIFLASSLLGIVLTASINFIVDPLWSFDHSNPFNAQQKGFDERQQKTNYIKARGLSKYEGILLGSSRTVFINQNDFENMRIYNYSLNGMMPYEYKGYIDYVKKIKKDDFKYMIIGLDFFGTDITVSKKVKSPEFYINNAEDFLYRYQNLLSIDNLKISYKNIRYSLRDHLDHYSRDNVKFKLKETEQKRIQNYTRNLKKHTLGFMNEKYKYNPKYIDILKQVKEENPKTKIIVLTPPVTADLLASIMKNSNRINEFERWLKEVIEVFGEVHHFMSINTITTNLQNYFDDDHYYPYIGTLLANKLSGKENEDIPNDFGIVLNKSNIDKYMGIFKKQLENYKNPLLILEE